MARAEERRRAVAVRGSALVYIVMGEASVVARMIIFVLEVREFRIPEPRIDGLDV